MEKDPTLAIKGTRKRRAAFTANRTYASELAWNAGSCSKYEGNYLKVTHIHTYFVEWRGDAAARTDHVKICERLLDRSIPRALSLSLMFIPVTIQPVHKLFTLQSKICRFSILYKIYNNPALPYHKGG